MHYTVYRKVKFIPQNTQHSASSQHSGYSELENYIYNTKDILDKHLPKICAAKEDNLTPQQRKSISKLQRTRQITTIKPADKNLGIVIMDTDDYVDQCSSILAESQTYRPASTYPHTTIKKEVEDTIIPFKETLKNINPHLYKYLSLDIRNQDTPMFYGIPKIHKKYVRLPPMRPIISQSCSPLAPSARFIDHILQPLAQSYNDYLQNSTALTMQLQCCTCYC